MTLPQVAYVVSCEFIRISLPLINAGSAARPQTDARKEYPMHIAIEYCGQ